jgi:hypothetical protein
VPVFVQARRPDRDRRLARRDGQDAAADAALAGQAHLEGELAGGVVVAAGHHHRADPPRVLRADHLLAADRVDAVVGQEQPCPGQLAAGDAQARTG